MVLTEWGKHARLQNKTGQVSAKKRRKGKIMKTDSEKKHRESNEND